MRNSTGNSTRLGAVCAAAWGLVLLIAILMLGAGQAHGQTQPVTRQPDCQLFFSFTAAGTQQFNNRSWGCSYWIVTYNAQGFGALSLAFQDAPDAGGVPGAWVNFAGTLVLGVNPNVALTQASTEFQGYYPWLRVNLGGLAGGPGTVVGTAYGWRTGPPNATLLTGTPNVNIASYGGVAVGAANGFYVRPGTGALFNLGTVVAGADGVANGAAVNPAAGAGGLVSWNGVYNGTTWDRQRGSVAGTLNAGLGSGVTGGVIASETVCDLYAPITLAAAIGYTEVVALAAGQQIRVCNITVSFAGNETPSLAYGTGVNCAAGTTAITGGFPNVLAVALDFASPLRVPVANALCVRQTVGAGGGGVVNYAIY